MNKPQYLILGQILRPHGIRGELKMRVATDYPERLLDGNLTIFLGTSSNQTDDLQPYQLRSARFHKDNLLLTVSDIETRNDAEQLRGQTVFIDIEHAIPLDNDELYLYQLIGLSVETEANEPLGQVHDVIETGANDVYVIRGERFGELLIPIHDETLINIDIEQGIITVKLPDGLLPK